MLQLSSFSTQHINTFFKWLSTNCLEKYNIIQFECVEFKRLCESTNLLCNVRLCLPFVYIYFTEGIYHNISVTLCIPFQKTFIASNHDSFHILFALEFFSSTLSISAPKGGIYFFYFALVSSVWFIVLVHFQHLV